MYYLRHMKRVVPSVENLSIMQGTEPGVLMFKGENLHFRVALNPTTQQSLHLKATLLDNTNFMNQWETEELQILEKFYETKVSCGLYRLNSLTTFGRILGAPYRILKDFVQIMRLELAPERNLKWSVQWCLTVPPGVPPISGSGGNSSTGAAAVVINMARGKVIFMLQLTRTIPPGTEVCPQTIIVPVLYDINTNNTQMMEVMSTNTQANMAINNMFKRFAEFNPKPVDCSIYPAIRELLSNLVVPM